ncbi:MAG: RsmE family RNA methyltransferase [Verrucomicrobiota bacterium]
MAGFRSYFPNGNLKKGQLVSLSAIESRHLVKALRAKIGDPVTLFDGQGEAWTATINGVGREAEVLIGDVLPIEPAGHELILGLGMLKGKAMDSAIKLAVEIGATSLFPLATERTEVRLGAARAESKHEHWQTVAIEAAKQSGNLGGLAIHAPQSLASWTAGLDHKPLLIVASLEEGAQPILETLAASNGSVCIAVGPEGDFSPSEYLALDEAGFLPVSFGSNVLRAETAVAYALSVIKAHHSVQASDSK